MGTITKALELMSLFTPDRTEIGLGEFARLANRDKATVHRHLSELEGSGFLEQNPATRAYRLGPALLRLAALREASFPMAKLLRPMVVDLSETVGELVHVSLLQGHALSPLVHSDPKVHGTQVHFDPSEMLPLHATASGLSVLAFLPPDQREKVLSRPLSIHTSKTRTEPDYLQAILASVRDRGICVTDGLFDEEVASIGAPLFGEEGHVIGAVAIAAPRVRATPDRLRNFTDRLRSTAIAASGSLGGTYPTFATAPAAAGS